MSAKITALMLALTLSLSACSLEAATDKLDSYSKLSTQELAKQLVVDGSNAGNTAKKIAWCQAKVIVDSDLPQAVVDALTVNDGRTVVQRAKSLKRPGLLRKLKGCVKQYT